VIEELLARSPILGEYVGAPVVVACSGGADSVALLALAAHAGAVPVAVHVDHGLRIDSALDFAYVQAAAERLGGCRVVLRTIALCDGANVEERARDARYRELEAVRAELDAHAILVAHTMDDQAETVLLGVLRGSAASGLGGMPVRRGSIVRPLLGVRRSETAALCAQLGIGTVVDPMNAHTRFQRAWLRHELLPSLSARAERDLVPVLARQADVLRSESDYLDARARQALHGAGDPPRTKVLAALDPVIARRVVRIMCGSPPVSLAHVDAVLAVVRGTRLAHELPGGRTARRQRGCLVIE
jgi:tRNA(Ile)-lysidine synthase